MMFLAKPALRADEQAATTRHAAREPASRRKVLRAGWRWLVRLNARIEECWIGDLLGAFCLGLTGIALVVAAGVLQ
ncbi:hypothetical protein [Frigidibacter oleivorans]|uniref:hypothetical protein n=1 Tax=Frigidibacter oleivorans TaxID=2487129 RepID=UPI000F8F21BE|nr:hypothetical protein [Frigidibacter oleivorans]